MPIINYGPHMTTEDAPVIHKLGVVSDAGEMTPVVYKGRLCLIQTLHKDGRSFAALTDCEDQKIVSEFGDGYEFFSGYIENDVLYGFGTYRGEKDNKDDHIAMFKSTDGLTWEKTILFERPQFRLWNTSVCKGPDGYRMAIEVSMACLKGDCLLNPYTEPVGIPFTMFFLASEDLVNWTWLPDECCYAKERYSACPALRFANGYYYMIYLEALPLVRYEPYIVRTKDFLTWEVGYHNPVLWVSREDRMPKPGQVFDDKTLVKLRHYMNINDCDVDLCEYKGNTHIFYMTGDQLSCGFTCEALYEGGLNEFLEAFFR